jgi:endonuclease YncB( thermonuclease family)
LTAGLPAIVPAAARADELNGPAEVIDGNSLAIGGRAVRLFGIDAPDEDQTCRRGGAAWRCGQEAGWALAAKIELHWVLCDTQPPAARAPGIAAGPEPAGPDTPSPAVRAVCYIDGRRIDLAAWMVEQGWALADRRSAAYLAQEQAAQRAGRGLWSGTFEPPWQWRARR